MSSPMTSFPGRDFSDIGDEQARKLLRLGMLKTFRPVDALIERLKATDGQEWFRKVTLAAPFTTILGRGDGLITGRVMLAQLTALKEAGKRQARELDRNMRLIARAAYDLSIAAAIVHYGQVITTQSRTELLDVLSDLAEALPEPWAKLVVDATEKLATMRDGE